MASTLLSDAAAERLVETSRDIAGERLRSVTYFTRNDFDQLYLREDLERGADLSTFIGFEWRESWITEDAYTNSELGGYAYTLQAFENGYLLRVVTDHDGAFVTVDGLSLDRFEELATGLDDVLESLQGD